jgi:hypothetical protein
MPRPDLALQHARSLAPEILVIDHVPESTWARLCCETEKATRSWNALEAMRPVSRTTFKAFQYFKDHAELVDKLRILGPQAIERASEFAGKRNLEIDMNYAAAWVQS